MGSTQDIVVIRRAQPEDEADVIALLSSALGWASDDRHQNLYAWKHIQNPFGVSPAWVAYSGRKLVGFRTFMRWEFEHRERIRRAVRAVDTATHPEYRGRGIFSQLTSRALEELREEGVEFVFNTPNEQSRPGYVKLGWQVLGRLRVSVRPRSPWRALTLMRARGSAADLWPIPGSVTLPAGDALSDPGVEELLADQPPPVGLATRRTSSYLRWRYGFAPLGYQAICAEAGPQAGLVLYRLRHRGATVEASVCDVLTAGGEVGVARGLLRQLASTTCADYMLQLGNVSGGWRRGWMNIPRQGPQLTWRAVTYSGAAPATWDLSLGDIELF